LQLNPLNGNFYSDHLKAIHAYLFRDVHQWAGQFRTIPLAKAEDVRGGRIVRFTPPDLIEQELKQVFDELANEHFLEGLPRREFARSAAGLFSEINRIHPFREGNGRAQRQFVHFEVVSKERLIQASILSASGEVAMTERLFDEITDTERIQSLAKVIAHLERGQFKWNDVYLATTTSGHSYTGTFAGSDGVNFFFRDDEDRILVGRRKDLPEPVESGEKIKFTAS
jgi:cell filamentation protein, protein adenylyltransferase